MPNYRIPRSAYDRLMDKVHPEPNTGCWLTTLTSCHGYPMIDASVPGSGTRRTKQASRVVMEQTHGPLPSHVFVCHHCDNPACVNPAHLFLGSAKDNCDDMMRKGRMRHRPLRGEAHHNAKITDEIVLAIRSLKRSNKTTSIEIGYALGVHDRNVRSVLNRSAWRHL